MSETRRDYIIEGLRDTQSQVGQEGYTAKDEWAREKDKPEEFYYKNKRLNPKDPYTPFITEVEKAELDPVLYNYMTEKCMQGHGFLNCSQSGTTAALAMRGKPISFKISKRRYAFNDENDGSMTYREIYYINEITIIDEFSTEQIIENGDLPLAVVATDSKISVKNVEDGKVIEHKLVNDNILLFKKDKGSEIDAEILFDKSDNIKKRYGVKNKKESERIISKWLNSLWINSFEKKKVEEIGLVEENQVEKIDSFEENKVKVVLTKLKSLIENEYDPKTKIKNSHSRDVSAQRLKELLKKIDTDVNYRNLTMGQLRDILYAEHRGIFITPGSDGQWGTQSKLGSILTRVIHAMDNTFDYSILDDKAKRNWKSHMAHNLLHYGSSRETSLRYKWSTGKNKENISKKIEEAGRLAHLLIMCKDQKDYEKFILEANVVIAVLRATDPKSKLIGRLEDCVKGAEQCANSMTKNYLLVDSNVFRGEEHNARHSLFPSIREAIKNSSKTAVLTNVSSNDENEKAVKCIKNWFEGFGKPDAKIEVVEPGKGSAEMNEKGSQCLDFLAKAAKTAKPYDMIDIKFYNDRDTENEMRSALDYFINKECDKPLTITLQTTLVDIKNGQSVKETVEVSSPSWGRDDKVELKNSLR